MNYRILWVSLLALALCSGEENGKVVKSTTTLSNKLITIQGKDNKYVCATYLSVYLSSSLKEECRWKVKRTSLGYFFISSHGKYLSGNYEYFSPGLESYSKNTAVWKLYSSGSKWALRNIKHLTYLTESFIGLSHSQSATTSCLWKLNFYEVPKSANLKISSTSKTCIRSASGKYLSIGSTGTIVELFNTCNALSHWYLKRTSDGHYTIQNSYFKKYLVTELGFTFGASPSSKNGKWLITSYGKGFLIQSGSNFYIADSSFLRPSTYETKSSSAVWTLSNIKIEKKEKVANLHPKKYNLSLYDVKSKKYMTSFKTHLSMSNKNMNSLWVSVPVGKKAGKHYLVNFEGKYLTATSTSVTLSSKRTNEGLWKIEEINKKYWRLKNIVTNKYLHFSNSAFQLSYYSKPEWMVYNFKYSDTLTKKISKPLSFYNSKSKNYISINSGVPQMNSEAFPLTLKKQGVFYFIEYKGKYLSFSSRSISPYLSNKKASDALFKINEKSKGVYEFISYRRQGAKIAVSSSGVLIASDSYGTETQWKLSGYKKPKAAYQSALERKKITLYGYYHTYLTETNGRLELTKKYFRHHSSWRLERAGSGYYYLKNMYADKYLARNKGNLFLSSKSKVKVKFTLKNGNWIIQGSDNYYLRSLYSKTMEFNIWYNVLANWKIKQAPKAKKTAEKLEKYQYVSFMFSGMYLSYNEETKEIYYSNYLSSTSFWQLAWISSGYYSLQTIDGNYFLSVHNSGVNLEKNLSKSCYWDISQKNQGWIFKTYEGTYLTSTLTIVKTETTTVFTAVDGVKEYKKIVSNKVNKLTQGAVYFKNQYGYYMSISTETREIIFTKSLSWYSLWELIETANKAFDIKQYKSEYYLSVNKTEQLSIVKKSERNNTWNLHMKDNFWAIQNSKTMNFITMIDFKNTVMNSTVSKGVSFTIKAKKNPRSLKPKPENKLAKFVNKYILIQNIKNNYLSIKGKTQTKVDSKSNSKTYWKLLFSKSHDAYRFQAYEGGYFLAGRKNTKKPYLTSKKTSNTLWKFKYLNGHWALYNVLHKNYLRADENEVDFVNCLGELEQWHITAGNPPLPKVKPSKKPVSKPVKTLPKTYKGKIASFKTPNGKYLGANEDEKTIILTTILEDSYWSLVQKEEEIFYVISAYKTYLTLGSEGLYQSKTPKDGSKWKITIEGANWAIQSAVDLKYISITNEEIFIFTKISHYWYYETITTITTFITVYVENPTDYLDTGLFIQSESKMFLKYEDNKISALADQDSLWKITDAANGMFYVATKDNYYLHSAQKGQGAVLKKELSDQAKWKIEIKNDKWVIKSNRYGTYLSLNKQNELVCAKKQYKWQVKAITPTIFNRNVFIQDQKSKLFLGQELEKIKMLSEPSSDAYMMISRRRANIVSITDSWNNNFIESNKKISSSYELTNEGLWYIQENKKGVVFKNLVSGRYLYYNSDGELTTTFNQAKAFWTIYIA